MIWGKRTTGEPCFITNSTACDLCGAEILHDDGKTGLHVPPRKDAGDSLSIYAGGIDLCADCACHIYAEIDDWCHTIPDD